MNQPIITSTIVTNLELREKDNGSNHKVVKPVGKFQTPKSNNRADSMTLFFSFKLYSETFLLIIQLFGVIHCLNLYRKERWTGWGRDFETIHNKQKTWPSPWFAQSIVGQANIYILISNWHLNSISIRILVISLEINFG